MIKFGNLELKIPDVSRLLQTSTFNSKITEIEGKITTIDNKIPDIIGLASKIELTAVDNKIPDISGLASKTELKNVKNKIPDSNAFVKKTDYATEISRIKNDYVTNVALTSPLNDLRSQHIADEVKKVDDKVTKNSTDILSFESRLKLKNTLNDLEREASFLRGKYYFNRWSYLIYKPKTFPFKQASSGITHWKPTGIDNYSVKQI